MDKEDFEGILAGMREAVEDIKRRDREERTYMVASQDEAGDQHMFISDDLGRAIAAYREMLARYGNARTNEGLGDALGQG